LFSKRITFRYDHLSNVLEKVLDEQQPANVIDYFELYSQRIKEDNFQAKTQLNDVYVVPERVKYAEKVLPLLKVRKIKLCFFFGGLLQPKLLFRMLQSQFQQLISQLT
jgi:hypothetical protein